LATAGVVLAVGAIAADDRRLTWAAIAVLVAAVALRFTGPKQ
jgi:hypothetical protein